ncbi:YhcN/YlaJ family sporulation lipoprotein [Chengkuizengella sediminis]|uniref:YhcN/YlaJ family sporulation lipoprotein n=1 Tax=Chengkuizengella sediminis TaxID=1885917 RepID=UPI00138A5C0B|nr:YhcN/YlaJ family sporulation lipoprotein [Chengkuizengella sediminis]NDI33690.1 YhcN/YlaJ family sporulation lipoprotein [Chengkuizengella sediminis]
MRMLILFMSLLCILFGCNQQSENYTDKQTVKELQTSSENKNMNQAEVTKRLETLTLSIPEVNAANIVVIGNTALVGIDIDGTLERSKVGSVKYSVAEALSKDPYGANAVITADMDLNVRIKEIRNDIMKGKPISGFAEELADIVGRVIPQFPQNAIQNQQNKQINKPKNEADKNQLNTHQ